MLTKAGDEVPLGDDSFRGQFLVVGKAVTTRPLPPDLSSPTAANLEELAVCLLVSWMTVSIQHSERRELYTFTDKIANNGRNVIWLEHIDHLLRPE